MTEPLHSQALVVHADCTLRFEPVQLEPPRPDEIVVVREELVSGLDVGDNVVRTFASCMHPEDFELAIRDMQDRQVIKPVLSMAS